MIWLLLFYHGLFASPTRNWIHWLEGQRVHKRRNKCTFENFIAEDSFMQNYFLIWDLQGIITEQARSTREGNVLRCVCPFVQRGGGTLTR